MSPESADLERLIRSALSAPGYAPPCPPAAALQLVQLTADPNVSVAKIRGLVESEPMLAAQLLGTAQSAYYSRGNPITSLDDAITRLGTRAVGELFMQAALSSSVFRAPGYEEPMKRLRVHSVVSAHVARLICRRLGLPDDYAFMCGLLHDVGMAAAIILLADMAHPDGKAPYANVEPALLAVHEHAALILARTWQLPAAVQLVIGHHHGYYVDGVVHPLAASVCLADAIAAHVGADAGSETNDERGLEAAAALGLQASDVEGFALAGENFVSMA